MGESDRGLVVVHEIERDEEELVSGAKEKERRLRENNGNVSFSPASLCGLEGDAQSCCSRTRESSFASS